ncbi:MAG TPA: hypothetical protein VIY53_05675 [Acidobacteriaceae bacterium]
MTERTFEGPYVQVAAICMTPLVEQQGLLSVIRIQDRIQLAGLTEKMQPQPLNSLWLVVVLKSGELTGKFNLNIVPITPGGHRIPGPSTSVLLEGQERGAVVATPLMVVAEEEGLYWFEVTLEGTLLTRVPLRVMYQKMNPMPGMPFPPPQTD